MDARVHEVVLFDSFIAMTRASSATWCTPKRRLYPGPHPVGGWVLLRGWVIAALEHGVAASFDA